VSPELRNVLIAARGRDRSVGLRGWTSCPSVIVPPSSSASGNESQRMPLRGARIVPGISVVTYTIYGTLVCRRRPELPRAVTDVRESTNAIMNPRPAGPTCHQCRGRLALPKPWPRLAPLMAVADILACGLSAGLRIAVVSRCFAT
jgi:hypothetical protein